MGAWTQGHMDTDGAGHRERAERGAQSRGEWTDGEGLGDGIGGD